MPQIPQPLNLASEPQERLQVKFHSLEDIEKHGLDKLNTPSLTGNRISRSREGDVYLKNRPIAMAAVERLANFDNGHPIYDDLAFGALPIITPENRLVLSKAYVDYMNNSYAPRDCPLEIDRKGKWTMYVDTVDPDLAPRSRSGGGVTVRRELRTLASGSPAQRPIVFLITSGPHATIIIISQDGTSVWSCGYGFQGGATQDNVISEWIRKFTKDYPNWLRSKGESMAHHLECLQGALYTFDYFTPTSEHESKIAWVALLDNSMLDRIQSFLDKTTGIIYSGTYDPTRNIYLMTPKTNVVVDYDYLEASGWLGTGFNCFTWATHILGITSHDFRPADTLSLSQELFEELEKSRQNSRNITEAVNNCQLYFLEAARFSKKGGRKTRKNKRKTKRKRCTGKKRRYRTRR